jgi:hypothetical protein
MTTQPAQRQPQPEALGPGTEVAGTGEVAYGSTEVPRVFIEPPRDPADREAERAAARQRGGCQRCASLPDSLVQALGAALAAAREEGRRSR